MSDGIYYGYEIRNDDRAMMVLDDMSEMSGLIQLKYMLMDSAVLGGVQYRDHNGRTIRR